MDLGWIEAMKISISYRIENNEKVAKYFKSRPSVKTFNNIPKNLVFPWKTTKIGLKILFAN